MFFAAFIACSFALVCTPGGEPDTFQKEMCNCWSGYAPSTTDGNDCKTHPKCAPAEPQDVDSLHNYAPIRPTTVFAYDSLEIVQRIPMVANRKATWIQFVIPTGLDNAGSFGAKTCQYPGPLWNKTINSRDCIDEYRASVPWTQHGMCGFAKDTRKTTNSTNVYSSVLFTTVTETYTTGEKTFQRLSTTSYLVSVSFVSQKTLSSDTISAGIIDPTAAGVLSKYVVSESVYDATTGSTVVELVTTALWPYKLDADNIAFDNVVPFIADAVVTITAKADSSLSCGIASRSTCAQRWLVTISSAGSCINNLKGSYNFVSGLVCRDNTTQGVAGGCPAGTPTLPLSITVHTTQLCDSTPVDTSSGNSFSLTPYSDAARQISAVQFQTGDKVYWAFDIANPLVSIKAVTINTILMSHSETGTPDILYSADAGGVTAIGSAVNLEIQGIAGAVIAGSHGTLTFNYDLFRSQLPNTVGALTSNNLEVQVATSIVVDIEYYGNTKRSVTMELAERSAMELSNMEEKSAGSGTRSIRVIAADLMSTSETHNAEDASKLFAADASLLKASLVVVVGFLALFLF